MARAPLTPPDCNLQDFHRMMLDITRLRGSAFDATIDDGAWRAGLNLWMSAWHHLPAASLPDDDGALAKAAGLGRDVRTWRKVKAIALRNWVKCSDGLLYHPIVAELALEAWLDKLAQALSSGAGNAKRWGTVFDAHQIDADIEQTVRLLTALNPKSKALLKVARRKPRPPSQPDPDGTVEASRRDSEGPLISSQENRKGTDVEDTPNPQGGRADEFAEAWGIYPEAGRATVGEPTCREAWAAALGPVTPAQLLAAVQTYAASEYVRSGGRPKRFDRWLAAGAFSAFVPKAAASSWHGPAEVRQVVVGAMGEAWTATWLDRCWWRDLPDRAVLSSSGTVADRLQRDAGAALEAIGVSIQVEAAA